jgi:hypothetical protein
MFRAMTRNDLILTRFYFPAPTLAPKCWECFDVNSCHAFLIRFVAGVCYSRMIVILCDVSSWDLHITANISTLCRLQMSFAATRSDFICLD